MKVQTGLHPRPAPRTFVAVKVRASADLVLAALAPFVHGTPRDVVGVVRGAPLPPDGRDLGRRAILYRVERDPWTTILREGDPHEIYDAALARRLSRALATRAFAIYLDGRFQAGVAEKADLVYDIFERGELVEGVFAVEGAPLEAHGVDAKLVEASPLLHSRTVLQRETATNDRVLFADFDRAGALRGRWDLPFDRAVLLPDLVPIEDEPEAPRARKKATEPVPHKDASDEARLGRIFGSIVDEKLSSL
jgi:hypothetical protein